MHVHDGHHDCLHDSLPRALPPLVVAQRTRDASRARRLNQPPLAALRARFHATVSNDPRTCYAAGQRVPIGESSSPSVDCRPGGPSTDCMFTCDAQSVLSATKQAVLSSVLVAASAWLGAAFEMRAPLENLRVGGEQACGFGGAVNVPRELIDDGAPDADVLMFVTVRPIPSATLAFAGHCQEDEGGRAPYTPRRPTVGHVNIDPGSLYALEAALAAEALAPMPHARHLEAAAARRLLQVVLHETMHVLGFTSDKLAQMPCPDAPGFDRHQEMDYRPRPCAEVGSIEPVVEADAADSLQGNAGGGTRRRVKLIATPRVVHMARRHLDCPTAASGADAAATASAALAGMPLEDCMGGADCATGEGTQNSHWEKRVMLGELMVGSSSPYEAAAISNLTLAVFEDAGWYSPRYNVGDPLCLYMPQYPSCIGSGGGGDGGGSAASSASSEPGPTPAEPTEPTAWWHASVGSQSAREPLLWGRSRGCSFVSRACSGPAWRATGYWCAADPQSATPAQQKARIGAEGCTLGRLAVGSCSLSEHSSPLPPAFRYLPQQPALGGAPIEDYCPVTSAYAQWDCRTRPATGSREAGALTERALNYGETRGVAARCFASTLINSTKLEMTQYHGCYAHRCLSPTQLQLRIGEAWHDCNAHSQAVKPDGWSGSLQCPPAEELCATSSDLEWPDIISLAPTAGPMAGGTALTIAVSNLHAAGAAVPEVRICGAAAHSVRITTEDGSSSSNGADGNQTGGAIGVVHGVSPALPAVLHTADRVSCHVLLRTSTGREVIKLRAFTYEGEHPASCHSVYDLDAYDGSRAQTIALTICLWPYMLTSIVGLSVLQLAWSVRRGVKAVHRIRSEERRVLGREVSYAGSRE